MTSPHQKKKTKPINFFITSTKIKQNNSNFVHSNFWTCWWILWSQFFMHRIYFISWKKEKARIKFMNFSQKYMGLFFFFLSPCSSVLFLVTWFSFWWTISHQVYRYVFLFNLIFCCCYISILDGTFSTEISCFIFFLQLYSFKYSYQIQIICIPIYLTYRWDPNTYYYSGSEEM